MLAILLALGASAKDPCAPVHALSGRLTVAGTVDDLAAPGPLLAFDDPDARDLWFRLEVDGAVHNLVKVTVDLFDPTGDLVFEARQLFTTDPNVTVVNYAGWRHAALLESIGKAKITTLDGAIPVAGTTLSRFPSPGTWEARASIDGVVGTLSAFFVVP